MLGGAVHTGRRCVPLRDLAEPPDPEVLQACARDALVWGVREGRGLLLEEEEEEEEGGWTAAAAGRTVGGVSQSVCAPKNCPAWPRVRATTASAARAPARAAPRARAPAGAMVAGVPPAQSGTWPLCKRGNPQPFFWGLHPAPERLPKAPWRLHEALQASTRAQLGPQTGLSPALAPLPPPQLALEAAQGLPRSTPPAGGVWGPLQGSGAGPTGLHGPIKPPDGAPRAEKCAQGVCARRDGPPKRERERVRKTQVSTLTLATRPWAMEAAPGPSAAAPLTS